MIYNKNFKICSNLKFEFPAIIRKLPMGIKQIFDIL